MMMMMMCLLFDDMFVFVYSCYFVLCWLIIMMMCLLFDDMFVFVYSWYFVLTLWLLMMMVCLFFDDMFVFVFLILCTIFVIDNDDGMFVVWWQVCVCVLCIHDILYALIDDMFLVWVSFVWLGLGSDECSVLTG